MSVQDLKDQVGDKARNRLTSPLVLGDTAARWSIAIPWIVSSILCPLYLGFGWIAFVLPVGLGALGSVRMLCLKEPRNDKRTWDIWAGWLICLYCLPLAKNHDALCSGV